MRFGVWTPLPHTLRPEPRMDRAIEELRGKREARGDHDESFEFAIDVLKRGERHGFDVSLIAARQLGPDLEAWTTAAALSGHTHAMELMVAVHPGINTPQMVAKMGASLDRITGGRVSLNVVNGWNVDEFNIFGNGAWLTESTDRYQRMDEYIEVIKRLWTEESFDFDGKFYHFKNGNLPTRPRQKPNPPIYAASRSPSGKETIAKFCDHWFVPDCQDYRRFNDTIALIEKEIAEMNDRVARNGRALGYGISGHVICCETREEAEACANSFEEYGKLARYNKSAMAALGACLVGTPDMIIERIHRYEKAGVQLMLLHFSPMIEGLERFAEKILPFVNRASLRTQPAAE